MNQPVHLPALHDPLDEATATPTSPLGVKEATARAAQLNARLKNRPDDLPTREELARILAGPLNQPEAAITHVETLLSQPDQSPEKSAAWLGLIGAWQIERLHDLNAGRETLRRLIREYPKSPTAFAAQRRLLNLDMEEQLRMTQANKPPPIRIKVDIGNSS